MEEELEHTINNAVQDDPQFFFRTSDIGHNICTVRFFVPTQQAANITRDFLSYVYKAKSRKEKS
ncbi:MAG: hypothetical protein H6868_00695 [Rhodospirillales bacterium]|nr:hypothetical protein [Rhodospirillales bacterium]